MKILLVISFLVAASAQCPGVYINGTYYDVDIIKENLTGVVALTFDRLHNTAYYTYNKDGANTLEYVKLDDKSTGTIDIVDPAGIAVDANTNTLFIATRRGLYEFDLNNNKPPSKVGLLSTFFHEDIKHVFVKDHIFYVKKSKSYVITDIFFGVSEFISALIHIDVDKFIIDDNNEIHYLANNTVTRIKHRTYDVGSDDTYIYLNGIFANDIAVDVNFKVYICTKDGVYKYRAEENYYGVDKVADVKDIKKLAFVNEDELIYVVNETLVKLNKSNKLCGFI